jgi:hypothetical protein
LAVFWDVAAGCVVEFVRRFRDFFAFIIMAMNGGMNTSDTSINSYKTTLYNIPEDSQFENEDNR